MLYFKRFTRLLLLLLLGFSVARAGPSLETFELFPADVGSASAGKFVPAPTQDPAIFGFGPGVQTVNFDVDPFGTPIPVSMLVSNQYASIGVTMNSIPLSTASYGGVNGGPATPPNQTRQGTPGPAQIQIFTFTTPVAAVGIVNTSPDQDLYEFFDESGGLLGSITDSGDSSINRFVGGSTPGGALIKTFSVKGNPFGGLEMDDLIFQPEAVVTDSDGDGVPDSEDACPQSPADAVVNEDGCAIADICPCDQQFDGDAWKNHGQYVVCVVFTARDFLRQGLIDHTQYGVTVSGAARSDCGHWN